MAGNTPDIGVVQVEIAKGRAIGEGCKIRRRLPRRADDSSSAAAAIGERDVTANANGLFIEGRETAADRIDEMDLDAFNRCVV